MKIKINVPLTIVCENAENSIEIVMKDLETFFKIKNAQAIMGTLVGNTTIKEFEIRDGMSTGDDWYYEI